ncbi:prepilin peptidase [Streptomyces sp. NPDC055092]
MRVGLLLSDARRAHCPERCLPHRCDRLAVHRRGCGPSPTTAVTCLPCSACAAGAGRRRGDGSSKVKFSPADRVVLAALHALTLPLAGAALALLDTASMLPDARGSWKTALLGAATLGAALWLMFLISPRSMGFGDVKLALTIGAVLGWYGWMTLLLGPFAGYLIAAAHGIATGKTPLPFGPSLLLGVLVGVGLGVLLA